MSTRNDNRAIFRRRDGETSKAYAAFCAYRDLPVRERSIDEAWHRAAPKDHPKRADDAPRHWHTWSTKYDWVARALAHDEHIAEQDRLLWEERRQELQRRDWEQADALRDVIERAIPHAEQFIQRRTHRVGDETIITLAFDIDALARVLVQASKLQRLATDEPTENINNLSGAALDAYAASLLARIVNGGQARGDAAPDGDGAADDTEDPRLV